MNKPIFRSAITDENDDVDVGYLALLWGLVGWALAVLTVLIDGTIVALMETKTGGATIQSIGVAVGAVSGGFATMLGAVGLFRMGDKPHAAAPAAPGTTTTTEKKETVVENVAAIPAKPVPVVVKNPAPLLVDDVGDAKPKRKAKGKR